MEGVRSFMLLDVSDSGIGRARESQWHKLVYSSLVCWPRSQGRREPVTQVSLR